MLNRQHSLRRPAWLFALLAYSAAPYCDAQAVNPRVERIRQDLGYYRTGVQESHQDLAAEVRRLREELRQTRDSLNQRLLVIERSLQTNAAKPAVAPQPIVPAPAYVPPVAAPIPPAAGPKNAAKLSVCSQGCDFSDLQKAVDAVEPGGEINVAPEVNGTCAVIRKPLHLVGNRGKGGRRAHLVGGACMGKAPLVTAAANITIEGFEISGITVDDGNGACIRLDPDTRDLTVRDVDCHDSQDGMLGDSKGHLLIEDSSFVGNGFGEGRAHGLYVGGDDILIRRCRILSTQNAGHSLKSGARKLTVVDSVIAALNGHNSRAIDAYGGGEVVLLRNVIQQGAQSENSDVVGLALEAARLVPDGHSFTMEDNWVIFDEPGRGVLIRGQKIGPINIRNNKLVGLKGMGLDVQDAGNKWFASRQEAGLPTFDGTPASLPVPAARQ